jgi:tetrahydromethanopterin S-methyltransferase subunit G
MICFEQVKDYDEIVEGLGNIEDLDKYFKDKVTQKEIGQSDYNYIHKRLYEILTKLKGQSKR